MDAPTLVFDRFQMRTFQFSDAEPFSEGLAVVKRGSGSAMRCEVIDRSGKTVWGTRPVIGRYSEGLASVSGPLVRSVK